MDMIIQVCRLSSNLWCVLWETHSASSPGPMQTFAMVIAAFHVETVLVCSMVITEAPRSVYARLFYCNSQLTPGCLPLRFYSPLVSRAAYNVSRPDYDLGIMVSLDSGQLRLKLYLYTGQRAAIVSLLKTQLSIKFAVMPALVVAMSARLFLRS